MACIEASIWNKAKADCENLRVTVKGVGYVATGRRGLRGLAAAPDLNLSASTYDPCAIAAQPSCQPRPGGLKAATPIVKPPLTEAITSAKTAGFNHWGLLAAVLVGGVVVYKISTR